MKRRNKELTVLISFVPGAVQMFQGFMKTGVIIMILFWRINKESRQIRFYGSSILQNGRAGFARKCKKCNVFRKKLLYDKRDIANKVL